MVLLTMTSAIVAAVKEYDKLEKDARELPKNNEEPSLLEPGVGHPISHGQIIDISKALKTYTSGDMVRTWTLNELLKGSEVYTPLRKPKVEQTTEYKELMARLRREEEARQYDRMTNADTTSSKANFSLNPSIKSSTVHSSDHDEEMTFADVNRQITLIINVLVTIIACGIAIWLVSSHWSAPMRLALSMGGSGLVAVAEVAIYAGYIRRLSEAKGKERKKKERKIIKDTWIIEKSKSAESLPMPKAIKEPEVARLRRKKP